MISGFIKLIIVFILFKAYYESCLDSFYNWMEHGK